jgi:hypothetical protein
MEAVAEVEVALLVLVLVLLNVPLHVLEDVIPGVEVDVVVLVVPIVLQRAKEVVSWEIIKNK